MPPFFLFFFLRKENVMDDITEKSRSHFPIIIARSCKSVLGESDMTSFSYCSFPTCKTEM